MQLIAIRQPLNGGDLFALGHDGQSQAGKHSPSGDVHRARTASAMITTFLRAGQLEPFADRVEQRDARIDAELTGSRVYVQSNVDQAGSWRCVFR
jgi:hypothetical protein